MAWFYSVAGEQKGPLEPAEFESLIATGVIRPETLVWQTGMPNWQPASHARPDLLPSGLPTMPAPPAPVYGATPVPAIIGGARYGGFWIRFVARLIDGLVLAIPIGIVIAICVVIFVGPAIFAGGIDGLDQLSVLAIIGGVITMLILNMCIHALYECYMVTHHDATLGKMALGLKVTTLEGQRLEMRQCLTRFVLYPGIGILGIIPIVGMLASVFILVDAIVLGTDARKQSLHDRYAKTLVVFK